jgi:hypothetical protein
MKRPSEPNGIQSSVSSEDAKQPTDQPASSVTLGDVDGGIHGSTIAGRDIHVYSRSQFEELREYLARAAAAFEARTYQLVTRPPGTLGQPYKFLFPFDIEDEDAFFGRDAASEVFYHTVLREGLTVLHGRSGAGKTSLLNAGLSPQLIRGGRLPVYARAYDDPIRAIKRTLAPPSLGPWPELLPKLSLSEFLALICGHLRSHIRELVLIIDQFEEFFVFWPEQDHRQPFVDTLAGCLGDPDLRVRLVIGIRSDFFSHLATFQGRIPHIFLNEYYLDAMTRDEAEAAITGPVAKLGRPVTYEPALVDILLDDLSRGGMELPHLQIICTRLYARLVGNEKTITLASYEELGQAEGVLGRYLHEVLDQLPGQGSSIAKAVLAELVSSEATRRVLSFDALTARVEAGGEDLNDVLTRLVDARLLRRDEAEGDILYEMAHEQLIEEIKDWIDWADLEFKQIEELLAREVSNWRVHRALIPEDRLRLIYPYRERFRGLDDEACECLLRSAIRANFTIIDWARMAGERGPEILSQEIGNVEWDRRLKIIEAIEALGDRRGAEALIPLLEDNEWAVRRAAAWTLGVLGNPRAVDPLITLLEDVQSAVRSAAAHALGAIGDPRAVDPLVAVLYDEQSTIRCSAARALGELGDPRAVEPLMDILRKERFMVFSRRYAEETDLRRTAVDALGRLGDSRAVESLVASLEGDDPRMYRAVARALRRMGAIEVLDSLEQEPPTP